MTWSGGNYTQGDESPYGARERERLEKAAERLDEASERVEQAAERVREAAEELREKPDA